MMKILIINTVRFKLNGISGVIKNYYQSMNKEGMKIDFLAIDTPCIEYLDFFKKNECSCHVLKKDNIIMYFLGIIKICRENKYDVVHIHGNSANVAIELLAVTFGGVKRRIVHSHNTATLHPMTHRLLRPLFSALCTDRLACGEDAGKWLFRDKPFIVLKNGIDVDRYNISESIREEYRNVLRVKKDEVLIGHVGNFIEQKNHTFLVDIFNAVHETNEKTKLLLISDGMLLPDIRKKVQELYLDDDVIFLGKTMQVEKYLQAMDIFLLPSLYEGFPLVLVEAQASGLPCFVSDTVSREVDLTDSCVFLSINNESVTDWKNEIINNASNRDKRDRKQTVEDNQRKIREKGYDIAKNANELRKIYFAGKEKENDI